MRQDFSEASLPERKVGLWTPWGVLRLEDREADKNGGRRLSPPAPCADDRLASRRAALRLA